MVYYPSEIEYSEKYDDGTYEYRHVILPKVVAKEMFKNFMQNREVRLLNDIEWRSLGITQSRGWRHYMVHRPEPQILLFRRPLGTDPLTGKASSYKILTTHFSANGEDSVCVSCTSIAGEEVVQLDMEANAGFVNLRDRIGDKLHFPPELLQLVLPNGDILPGPAPLTLVDLVRLMGATSSGWEPQNSYELMGMN